MIGPTGVGKTEIARRLARLTGAPFIKVEATKYTEVGYYGRDVESMIRELVENAIGLVRESERKNVEAEARAPRRRAAARSARAGARWPTTSAPTAPNSPERYERTREKMRAMLAAGEMDERKVEIAIEQKARADDAHRHGPGADRHRLAGHVRKDPAQADDAPRDDRGRGPPACCSSRNATP